MGNNKSRKYVSLTSSVMLALSLAACGTEETSIEVHTEQEYDEQVLTNGQAATSDIQESDVQEMDESEFAEICEGLTQQEDGSYYCDDENSEYHGNYFFNGLMFATLGAMLGNSLYKQQNLVNGTMRNNMKRDNEQTGSSSSSGGGGAAVRSGSSSSNQSTTNGDTSSKGNSSTSSGTVNGGKTGFGSGGSTYGGSASS